jgi:pyruvate/2-oxoacid:ferredoxin oxidoreductase alpha subunit
MTSAHAEQVFLGNTGATYDGAVDLDALRAAHRARYREPTTLSVDGNTAAAIPFLQWWRAPIVAGFPITPSTKWLEHLAAEVASGKFDVDVAGRVVRAKRIKLLESEHAVADYLAGAAAACRSLIVATATSSVGLDHMTETVRSLGASGLGNVMIVNVCRATANYPLCIEGDPSDTFAHRDDGFIQICCRGKQQIYDTILQLPALGMHPSVLTPTMPVYYGIKDSHRSSRLVVEPDDEVNAFLDELLAESQGSHAPRHSDFLDKTEPFHGVPPGLLDGDTSMGNCVTSAYFQGFKAGQKERLQRALEVLPVIGGRFAARFGRPGLEFFERHGMDDEPEAVLVSMGPDAGTAVHLLPTLRAELAMRIGIVVMRLLTPFPTAALAAALGGASAVGVVNNAHHHGRGHLTLDVADALAGAPRSMPIESFFCGLGGADVSVSTWRRMAEVTCTAARTGRVSKPWHLLHDGRELAKED